LGVPFAENRRRIKILSSFYVLETNNNFLTSAILKEKDD